MNKCDGIQSWSRAGEALEKFAELSGSSPLGFGLGYCFVVHTLCVPMVAAKARTVIPALCVVRSSVWPSLTVVCI